MISSVRDTVLTPEDDVEHGGNNWHESGSGKAKKEQVTWDEAHQEGGWHDGTTSPRHDGTTARLAAQTECVKIGVERKHHRATTKFYDKKVKLEQEDRYARPQIHCTALPISVPDRAWIISTPSICNYSPLDEEWIMAFGVLDPTSWCGCADHLLR